MAIKHFDIIVQGKVQGVFYRASAETEAQSMGLKGFVKNLPAGEVYIEAEGKEEDLAQFIEWCKKGPDKADVTNISYKEAPLKHFTKFLIQR